ncbi:hypothetical protein FPQ10_06985 [Allobacillus sp. SKP2-8]|uniref:hypothetical protein n=1 Tax=unclassified Allobacillus TaxID=2628859 RepID=UPI0011832791|nr:hypothetical protein [Allobacillus sp. SKP2-8]TSJ66586.1 hypothetical protein FPQ10_06985 [Allobacillus sp. SKP2-8]
MKTTFEEIIDINRFGENDPVDLNELAKLAEIEQVSKSDEKILFLGVDLQNDFLEGGALGVPDSFKDLERTLRFLYEHFNKISHIAVSLDTHFIQQIFHAAWWIDEDGNHPEPMTIISVEDVESGKWQPVKHKEDSLAYVKALEENGQKQLCIWPYHCIEGTTGVMLESQFAKFIHFHSFVHGNPIKKVVKGKGFSEMYGIVQPEVGREKDESLLSYLREFDKIIVAGQAESHCVYESVKQIVDHYREDNEFLKQIYVLTDGMSCIPGFEEVSEQGWSELRKTGIQLVDSTDLKL